jgi:molybdopterin molybdotransferase
VQPVEKTRTLEGGRRVEMLSAVEAGSHIARRGAEVRAGDLLMARGRTIDPASVAVLASAGKGRARVGRRPTVAVLVTGDELIDVWESPSRGRIRSNGG